MTASDQPPKAPSEPRRSRAEVALEKARALVAASGRPALAITARSVDRRYNPESKSINEFDTWRRDGDLDMTPAYQRGNVWKNARQSLLIDSIWRGLPIGAITIFKRDDGTYELVDGKQRLTTIFQYLEGDLVPRPKSDDAADADEGEQVSVAEEVARRIHGVKFADVQRDLKKSFRDMKLPTIELKPERDEDVVQIFHRMNTGLVSLSPQEIRNALYSDSMFLQQAVAVADATLAKRRQVEDGKSSWYFKRGLFRLDSINRMADVQLTCEILAALLDQRVHNRRDKLADFCKAYQPYHKPTGTQKAKLADAAKLLKTYLRFLDQIFDKQNLRDHGIGLYAEHHLYALIVAFQLYGLNSVKVGASLTTLRDGLTSFFKAVEAEAVLIGDGRPTPGKDTKTLLVRAYAATFTRGQVNGEGRRRTRAEMLTVLLTGLAGKPPSKNGFSRLQKEQIWALFPDKKCARNCGRVVTWDEFDAGHAVAKADGGSNHLLNGRIEHTSCNRGAGAKPVASSSRPRGSQQARDARPRVRE